MGMTDPEWEANPSLTRFTDVWPSAELSAADREVLSRRGYLAYELDERLVVLSLNTLPYSVSVAGAFCTSQVFRRLTCWFMLLQRSSPE